MCCLLEQYQNSLAHAYLQILPPQYFALILTFNYKVQQPSSANKAETAVVFYILRGVKNYFFPFIELKNSSFEDECIMCFCKKSNASSGFISDKWLRKMKRR